MATWLVYCCAAFVAVFEAISVYSTLVGERPLGAYQGLVVFLVLGLGASALVPSGKTRARLLVQSAVVLSAVGLLATLLIPARIAEARGSLPSGVPVAQTAVLMLFQLGWALTHWLGIVRSVDGRARHMPAAVGTVILFVGGFMLGRMDAGASTADSELGVVYERFASPENLAFAGQTETAGEASGSEFAHYHAGGVPMIGMSFGTREWFRRERIDSELTGIFERATPESAHTVVAREGYIVAGVEVQADDNISALRIQFAPYDGTFVSPYDRYWSDWYGGYVRGETGVRLDGASAPIVGLRGTSGMVLNSLSLMTAR